MTAQDQPTEVDASLRVGQLAVLAATLAPCLAVMFLAGMGVAQLLDLTRESYGTIAWAAIAASLIVPLGWMIWSFVSRGGFTFPLTGLSLVDSSGQPASRWQCFLRAAAMWLPIMLILASAYLWPLWIDDRNPLPWFSTVWLSCWAGVVLVFLGYLALTLTQPERGTHDRLADTFVVPK